MKNTNIPIYRAKKVNSDECVEGCLLKSHSGWTSLIVKEDKLYTFEDDFTQYNNTSIQTENENGKLDTFIIDPTTLSIHLPDMIASDSDRLLPNGEKDLRIFASLQEDGRGGDNIKYYKMTNSMLIEGITPKWKEKTCIFTKYGLNLNSIMDNKDFFEFKITGIKQ